MSDDSEKRNKLSREPWISQTPEHTTPSRYASAKGRLLRTIHPLGMRVLVKLRPENNMTDAGLYLPEGAKTSLQESLLGEVVEVASAVDNETDEETNISGIPLGALVLIPKQAGITVPWDDTLRVVDVKEVLALVAETEVL